MKFLFRVTLRRHDLAAEVFHLREPKRVPLVLSQQEIKRLERLVTDFLSYAKPRPLDMENVRAVDLLEKCRELLHHEFDRRGTEIAVDGGGFRITPLVRASELHDRLGFSGGGGIRIKDETGNVSGSHKARHLMGVMLALHVAESMGNADPAAPLAIASSGRARRPARVASSGTSAIPSRPWSWAKYTSCSRTCIFR